MIDSQLLSTEGEPLLLNDAKIRYYESFFTPKETATIFDQLLEETLWQQDPITVFG